MHPARSKFHTCVHQLALNTKPIQLTSRVTNTSVTIHDFTGGRYVFTAQPGFGYTPQPAPAHNPTPEENTSFLGPQGQGE